MTEAIFETAQAVLTGYDTALNKQFREEDRKWRAEDLAWRDQERFYNEANLQQMELEREWHLEELDQRLLDNIRYLWQRYVDRTRSDMEERSEQLKGISNLAALVAGFAVSGFLQFTITADMASSGVFFAFGLTTALVCGLMLNTMMICTLIQASILKTGRKFVSEWEEARFVTDCLEWFASYSPGKRPPQPQKMFSRHWEQQCESDWVRAFFMFSAGVPIFFANLAVAGWIKFHFDTGTAIGITVVMATALLYFIVSQIRWVSHILEKNMVRCWAAACLCVFHLHIQQDSHTFDSSTTSRLPFDWHLPPQTLRKRRSATPSNSMAGRVSTPAGSSGAADVETPRNHMSQHQDDDDDVGAAITPAL